MLRNKPTIIAMSSVREKLSHNTDCITLRGSWLHWCTPNQTHARTSFILFYSCLAV